MHILTHLYISSVVYSNLPIIVACNHYRVKILLFYIMGHMFFRCPILPHNVIFIAFYFTLFCQSTLDKFSNVYRDLEVIKCWWLPSRLRLVTTLFLHYHSKIPLTTAFICDKMIFKEGCPLSCLSTVLCGERRQSVMYLRDKRQTFLSNRRRRDNKKEWYYIYISVPSFYQLKLEA